jgi:segregation and condensation protein A
VRTPFTEDKDMDDDYRVQLDIYNGPLDLLLFLIRKEEVDIYDIPIARVTDQYMEYVRVLHQLDPNMAGEFLVMAATLMEIKSRMLLPHAVEEEAGGEAIDPRSELVRQLLEYKRFKDAAGWLADAAEEQSQKFPRVPVLPQVSPNEIDLEDIQIWDLVEAFSRLLQATLAGARMHEVEKDDTPLALHQQDIVDRLQREGPLPFSKVFEGRSRKVEMIGLFLALLELIRQGIIRIEQDAPFSEIYLFLKVDLPEEGFKPQEEAPPAPITAPADFAAEAPVQPPSADLAEDGPDDAVDDGEEKLEDMAIEDLGKMDDHSQPTEPNKP